MKLFEEYKELESKIPENLKNRIDINRLELKEDGTYLYRGDLNLSDCKPKLTSLKVLGDIGISEVGGNFWCYDNQLTSLEHCPSKVGGIFWCLYNQLTSLEHCPSEVGGSFWCSDNQLTTLEHCPSYVDGDFRCQGNQLTSLEHCPSEVRGVFKCSNNQLTSLEHCPSKVGGSFWCSDNQLTSLEHCPSEVGRSFWCSDNQLLSIEHDCDIKRSFITNDEDSKQPLEELTSEVIDSIDRMTHSQRESQLEFFRNRDERAYKLMLDALNQLGYDTIDAEDDYSELF